MTERFRLHIITDQDVFRHQLYALHSGPPLDATYSNMLVIIFKLSLIHVFGKHGSVGVGQSVRVPPSARVSLSGKTPHTGPGGIQLRG